MAYNFDQLINRRPTNSNKWNFYPEDILPMWVADMDFVSPHPVIKALRQKVEHGIFGYELPSAELIETVCDRMARLYGWAVTPQQVIALPGLVTGVNVACRAVGGPGDGVLIQTPVYHPFLSAPKNNGRLRQDAPLTYVSDGDHAFHYEIDYDSFETAIQDNTRLFLFCNPHNPTGQVYTPEQLTRLAEICLRHNLVICSDEIHGELVLGKSTHTPLATLSPEIADRTITLIAPSKTFNIAGLGCSFAIVTNPELRQQVQIAAEGIVPLVNALGLAAGLAAFRDDPEVNDWLTALKQYLTANRDVWVETIARELPMLKTAAPDATYLAWLDCRGANLDLDPYEFFLQKASIGFSDGAIFGANGQGFVRVNFGCPRPRLMQALEQMKAALTNDGRTTKDG
ncbi:MAG: putative C-S lyase [Chloroflexi bacterium]|nr:putative C-S lyase [Chloroflexota bacterium]